MQRRIEASGDACLVVIFDAAPGAQTSREVAAAAAALRAAALPGVHDVVPTMVTVGLHYRIADVALRPGDASPFDALRRQVDAVLDGGFAAAPESTATIDIPVCYGGAHGPDLAEAAQRCGLSPEALIELHARDPVPVLMLGFLPGHPYLGFLDERLSLPRRPQPRLSVPAGSIGLANRQSVIYPLNSPGGWSLIGRTPLRVFDPQRERPCLLQAGDEARFVPISARRFDELAAESLP
jgi:KipI family sensor histidine kinase inhibitor